MVEIKRCLYCGSWFDVPEPLGSGKAVALCPKCVAENRGGPPSSRSRVKARYYRDLDLDREDHGGSGDLARKINELYRDDPDCFDALECRTHLDLGPGREVTIHCELPRKNHEGNWFRLFQSWQWGIRRR